MDGSGPDEDDRSTYQPREAFKTRRVSAPGTCGSTLRSVDTSSEEDHPTSRTPSPHGAPVRTLRRLINLIRKYSTRGLVAIIPRLLLYYLRTWISTREAWALAHSAARWAKRLSDSAFALPTERGLSSWGRGRIGRVCEAHGWHGIGPPIRIARAPSQSRAGRRTRWAPASWGGRGRGRPGGGAGR